MSIFLSDQLAPFLHRMYASFSDTAKQGSVDTQFAALKERHASQELAFWAGEADSFVKARLGELEQMGPLVPNTNLLVLDRLILDAIERTGLEGVGRRLLEEYCVVKEELWAKRLEKKSNLSWMLFEQQQKIERETAERRWQKAVHTMNNPGTFFLNNGQDWDLYIPVTPTGATNTVFPAPTHFRLMSWNLENFTRDARPAGNSSAVDSPRNQARIAAVARAMHKFDVHALLVMETGSDVGGAMTRVAARLETFFPGERIHPLVSTTTHARPVVQREYLGVVLGAVYPQRALALLALSDVYRVAPVYDAVPSLTLDQITDGLRLLCLSSAEAKSTLHPVFPKPEGGAPDYLVHLLGYLDQEYVRECQSMGVEFEEAFLADSRLQFVENVAGLLLREIGNPVLFKKYVCQLIDYCRESIVDLRPIQELNRTVADPLIGWLQLLELTCLFFTKLTVEDGWPRVLHETVQQGMAALPLIVFYYTGVQRVNLTMVDPGGVAGVDRDMDVLFDSLLKVGLLKFRFESYGLIYREPFDGAAGVLLDCGLEKAASRGVGQAVPAFESLEMATQEYGVVTQSLTGGRFAVQDAESILTQRSAFRVMLPASRRHLLPVAVYHTRYGGSRALQTQYNADHSFGKGVADVYARLASLSETGNAMQPGHPSWGPPLLVGDFNTPSNYIEGLRVDRATDVSRAGVLFATAMDGIGLTRHSSHPNANVLTAQYPRTTLKVAVNLALEPDEIYSQPYDGVYEPFHYAAGTVRVASAAVKVPGLFPAELYDEVLTGDAPNWDALISEDENSIEGAEDDGDVVDGPQDGAEEEGMVVTETLAGAWQMRWNPAVVGLGPCADFRITGAEVAGSCGGYDGKGQLALNEFQLEFPLGPGRPSLLMQGRIGTGTLAGFWGIGEARGTFTAARNTTRSVAAEAIGTVCFRVIGRTREEKGGESGTGVAWQLELLVSWYNAQLEKLGKNTSYRAVERLSLLKQRGTVPARMLAAYLQMRRERVPWITARCREGVVGRYAVVDPLDGIITTMQSFQGFCSENGVQGYAFDKAIQELRKVRTRLQNIETRQDVRDAIAYRVLVSDHVPVLVEFDLAPN